MKQLTKSNSKPKVKHSLGFEAIGTTWWVGFYEDLSLVTLTDVERAVMERIEEFDLTYSRFRPDSLVSAIARRAGTYELPADAAVMMSFYKRLYEASDGAVTPLIGRALADAGYDAAYSLRPKPIRPVPQWQDTIEFKAGALLTAKPVLLDFGAAGKGYLVDLVAGVIERFGITSYCVDAGGDMIYRHTSRPILVGLEHPDDASLAIGVAELFNRSLCGSATNRRAWRGLNHVIDPRTRQAVQDVKAVWVMADNTMLADGLATALFLTPASKLRDRFDFEFVIVYRSGSAEISNGFNGELYEV